MNLRGKAFLLFITLLLVGCSAPQSPATASPSATATTILIPQVPATRTSSPTPLPSSTPVMTATPPDPLTTLGPYLAYFRQQDQAQQVVLLDEDALGRQAFTLPADNVTNKYAISPDGRWLAYYSGSVNTEQAHNLALNLLDLKNGKIRFVSKLLSRDYPDNFAKSATKLSDPSITTTQLQQAFIAGITNSLAWSPDGNYLAFAGEMDGPSSDVYIYDMKNWTVQRKSKGPSEIQWIGWAPDGKWIVYSAAYRVEAGMTFELYSVPLVAPISFRVLPINRLTTSSGAYVPPMLWVNDHEFLDYDNAAVPGDYELRLVDVAKSNVIKVWDGNFDSLALNTRTNWVAFYSEMPIWPYHEGDPKIVPGSYLINLTNLLRIRIDVAPVDGLQAPYDFLSASPDDQNFIASTGAADNLLVVSSDRTARDSGIPKGVVSLAPNRQYWVVISDKIRIYSADNRLFRAVPLPDGLSISSASQLIWRPDSVGLYLTSGSSLYTLDLLSGGFRLVETNLDQPATFTWVRQR